MTKETTKTIKLATVHETDEKKVESTNNTATTDNSATAGETEPGSVTPIAKPSGFSLDKFKSKRADALANIGTELTGLKHYPISNAKDFVRLHPSEDTHWSFELWFVNVPIKGEKNETLHLIDEDLAMRYLPSGKIMRFRLALATKPFDVLFLCHVPTRNLDNDWNKTNLEACEKAKTHWVQAVSRKKENVEGYKIEFAHDQDAFPDPEWPKQSLDDLIYKTFAPNCIISDDEHPGLLRLLGAKQNLS
jgi:hypothetical protein